MEHNPMLDFVKALGHTDRLRVIGVLTQSPANIKQVAELLNIPFKDAMNHMAFLEDVGAVRAKAVSEQGNTVYELAEDNLENVARQQFQDQKKSYEPAPNLDAESRKVLKAYLNADGTIQQLPLNQPAKLQVILDYLLQSFNPGVLYTEKEVNQILGRFNEDISGLRRDLIDRGMLARKNDGSQYWRPV